MSALDVADVPVLATGSRPYRVLHVVNDVATGGAQSLLETLARDRLAHQQLDLCVLRGPDALSDRLAAVFDSVTYLDFARSSNALPRLVRQLDGVIGARDPDVVHSHLLQSDLGTALLPRSIPRVSTVHTTGMADGDRRRSRLLGRAMGMVVRRHDAVVACDPTCLAWTREMHYPERRMSVIANGIAVPPRAATVPPPLTVLSLARWHPMKDHANLFAALAVLRGRGVDAHAVCAGSGVEPDNAELTALIAEHGIADAVTLLGAVPDVRPLLRDARLLVVSSAYGEAMPMAGLEALAAARPVVTTDVGGCSALAVDPALVVAPRDAAALATALGSVLSRSDAEWTELSVAAHLLAATTFAASRTVADYDAVYRSVLTRRGRR